MIRSLISGFGNTQTSWVIRSSPSTGSLYVVGFNGSNLFITVNVNTNVYTSPDGVTWTTASSGISTFPYGITYSNTAFILVGSNTNTGYPAIATSTDGGITWTTRSTTGFGTSSNIQGVCWSGSYLVAVSNEGHIATSTGTGSSWTQRYKEASGNFYSVAYGGGIYVACGSGALATSINGTSWTNNNNSACPFTVNSVTYGNSRFVAVGISGKIATSSDGINWTLSESPVTTSLRDVVYGNSKFVAVGGGSPTIITSPTGF